MRIDPKGTVAGRPALLVRQTLRHLRTPLPWGLSELESAASVEAGEGRALIKALLAEGLIEAAGRNAWKVTQAGQTLSSATAARRVTRATAQRALQQFLGRVEQVNNDPCSLGKVTRVVLFGSMLEPAVERLSDVDLAVEVASMAFGTRSAVTLKPQVGSSGLTPQLRRRHWRPRTYRSARGSTRSALQRCSADLPFP
jgi:predicted nucleotidyltransferase